MSNDLIWLVSLICSCYHQVAELSEQAHYLKDSPQVGQSTNHHIKISHSEDVTVDCKAVIKPLG